MAAATGVLCGAGFETPAEVMYLEKKLLVIPMKGQYEQQCNAAALKMLGVPVIKNLKAKRHTEVQQWIESDNIISLDFPEETEIIIESILHKYLKKAEPLKIKKKAIDTTSKFRNLLLKKVFYQPTSK
jgi:predicted glycosyltransferase